MFLPRGLEAGFQQNVAFVFCRVPCPDFQVTLQEDVAAGIVLMYQRRASFKRLLQIEDRWQGFPIACNKIDCFLERLFIFGQDQCYCVAAMAGLVINKHCLVFSDHPLLVCSGNIPVG